MLNASSNQGLNRGDGPALTRFVSSYWDVQVVGIGSRVACDELSFAGDLGEFETAEGLEICAADAETSVRLRATT